MLLPGASASRRPRRATEASGRKRAVESVGVGGPRKIAAYTLPEVRIEIGGRQATLKEPGVYTQPLREGDASYLFCNVGFSFLQQFDEYRIDFQTMSLGLR